jgi:hypothetical protein
MAVVVVTRRLVVFLPPIARTTSHLPEVCLFDSGSSVSGGSAQQMPPDGDRTPRPRRPDMSSSNLTGFKENE